jgi:hypothetical protein
MKTGSALAGGLAGAAALNLIHETYRQIDKDAPLIHLIGEEALLKLLHALHLPKPGSTKELYQWTLAADVFSNAVYYSLIGGGKRKQLLKRGLLFGLAAGAGAVFMPEKMGLHDAPSTRTTETKVLTVLWYTIGGVVAAGAIRLLRRKKKKMDKKSTFYAKPSLYRHGAQM